MVSARRYSKSSVRTQFRDHVFDSTSHRAQSVNRKIQIEVARENTREIFLMAR
jgi:hypothetical protein